MFGIYSIANNWIITLVWNKNGHFSHQPETNCIRFLVWKPMFSEKIMKFHTAVFEILIFKIWKSGLFSNVYKPINQLSAIIEN